MSTVWKPFARLWPFQATVSPAAIVILFSRKALAPPPYFVCSFVANALGPPA